MDDYMEAWANARKLDSIVWQLGFDQEQERWRRFWLNEEKEAKERMESESFIFSVEDEDVII